MKYKLLILSAFFVGSSFASAAQQSDLESSGFKMLESNKTSIKLQFRDDKAFILSRQKFSSQKEAENFCKENALKLDPKSFEKTLLLAMSGAARLDENIGDLITFKLGTAKVVSGIWAWTGSNEDVQLMTDGGGEATSIVNIKKIVDAANQLKTPKAALIPAICE